MASAWEGQGWSKGWSWAEVAQRLVLRKQDDGQFRAMSASCGLGRPDLGPKDQRMDGQPGEDRNAWSLDGLVIPCRWRARSRIEDDEVNAG